MKRITLLLIASLSLTSSFSQCATHKYVSRADSLFKLQITKENFKSGTVFLTLDTTNMSDIFAPSNYIETTDPSVVIKNFVKFMKSIKVEGNYYNYYELINSPFYDSPLNISYVINTKADSYLIRIWTDKNDISKVQGITVGKYSTKQTRTPW
jgi:hypothetical protein